MSHRVFISYARSSSAGEAVCLCETLREQLGIDAVFLDTGEIETGEEFPAVLADGVLDAQVVVVLADARYFERWYCLRELRLALLSPEQIVVALGERPDLTLLPGLSTKNWPQAKDTKAIAELVVRRLAEHPPSIRSRDAARAQSIFQITVEESRLPQPLPISSEIPTAGHIAPSISDRFVGRSDDLAKIHFALQVEAARTVAITAAGGFGKTRLALEYLHRYGPRLYPGGLFWFDAGKNVGLVEQFYSILSALRSGDVPPLSEMRAKHVDISGELSTALRSATRPVLYIIDDVPEVPSGMRPRALSEFCPAIGGAVTVLATSRQRTFDQHVRTVTVGTMQRESSVALLTHGLTAPGALRPEEWAEAAAWVGALPLALDLLNRSLQLGLAADELLGRVRSSSAVPELDRQAGVLKTQVSEDTLKGLTETFAMSLQALDEPAQRCAFALAIFVPGAPIPTRFVNALPADINTDRVRADLLARHFVTGGGALVFGSMHRLLADFLRHSFEGLRPVVEAVHAVIDAMNPELVDQPQHWPEMRLCEPHAAGVLHGLIELIGSAMKAGDDEGVHRMAADAFDVAVRLSLLARSQGDYATAAGVMDGIYPLMKSTLGDSDRRTLTVGNNLAEMARELGELDRAQRILERVVEAQRRTRPDEDPETLASMGNLALVYLETGKLLEAERLQTHLLELSQRIFPADSQEVLRAMNNLASTLSRNGDVPRARALREHVLEVRTRTLGLVHVDTLRSATNLGDIMVQQGDAEGSRRLLTPLLPQAETLLGEMHPEVLHMASVLTSALYAVGSLEQAYDLALKTFLRSLHTSGESSPATAWAAKAFFVVLGGRRDRGEDVMPPSDVLQKLKPFATRMTAGQR